MSEGEGGKPSPLDDLLVSEISEDARTDMAEALDGLVGITKEEHVITLKGGMDALDLSRQVVAYMLARYARDLLQHGHIRGSTARMGADDLGAALGVHAADVDDAAMTHGDLRWYREGNQVELPHERVRHAAKSLSFARNDDVEKGPSTEDGGDGGG